MIYIGIDNGVSGGIVALSPVAGCAPILSAPMPVQRARRGNEIDVREVGELLRDHELNRPEAVSVIIEEPVGSQSAHAAASMAGSFHALRGFLETSGFRWHRITPQSWQRVMIPGKGDTKARALEAARRLWPAETWLASDRSRVPHDGIIDAALIAEFGRRSAL